MKALGKAIKQRRLRLGLTLRGVAKAVGKSHAWLSNLEAGEIDQPRSEDLTAIAEHLGEDPAEFLRLAGRVNLAAAHIVPKREEPMPEWARRLEKKVDDLNALLEEVGGQVGGSADGLAQILAELSKPKRPPPGRTPGVRAVPPKPVHRTRGQKRAGGPRTAWGEAVDLRLESRAS